MTSITFNNNELFGLNITQQQSLNKVVAYLAARSDLGDTVFPTIPWDMFFGFDFFEATNLLAALKWAWGNAVSNGQDIPAYYLNQSFDDIDGLALVNVMKKLITNNLGILQGLYVNSVSGSNANNGLSAANAKQTLAGIAAIATAGKTINLVRGSSWKEELDPACDLTIVTSGSGVLPLLDGADPAGTWTVTGTTDVWTQSWTRPGPIQGSDDLGLWIDGVRVARFGTSIVDIGTNGGWWCDAPRALTANVYVKVAGGTNPNSDGHLYEISKRNNGFNWHAQQSAPGTYTVGLTGPMELKRFHAHYGCLSAGQGTVSRLLLRDNGVHHMVTMGTSTTDVIATEYLASANGIPFVAYRNSGAGFSHTFNRCLALFPGGASRVQAWNGFYAHASIGNPDGCPRIGCVVRGMDGFSGALTTVNDDGCYSEDPYAYAFDLTGATSNVLTRCLVNDTTSSPNSGGNVAFRKSNTVSTASVTDSASYTRIGGAVTADTGGATYTQSAFVSNGNGIGCTNACPITVNYCVFDSIGRCYNNLGTGYVGDHNVFYFRTLADQPWMHYNGTLYTSFASFQAATGQDAHSVYLLDVDQTAGNANAFWLGVKNNTGGPINGDFRINPNAKVYTAPGVSRIGTFTDGSLLTLAGPQTHRDYNAYTNVSGPPAAWPALPTTITQMRALIDNPASWTY